MDNSNNNNQNPPTNTNPQTGGVPAWAPSDQSSLNPSPQPQMPTEPTAASMPPAETYGFGQIPTPPATPQPTMPIPETPPLANPNNSFNSLPPTMPSFGQPAMPPTNTPSPFEILPQPAQPAMADQSRMNPPAFGASVPPPSTEVVQDPLQPGLPSSDTNSMPPALGAQYPLPQTPQDTSLDGGLPPTPTFIPPAPSPTTPAPLSGMPTIPSTVGLPSTLPPTSSAAVPEPAPTDLSHLTGTSEQAPPPELYVPPVSNQENLVMPQQSAIPENNAPPSAHKPKATKIIITVLGVILLLAAIGAGAYFFMNSSGSTSVDTTSLPAQESTLTNPPNPIVNASPSAQPSVASSSASPTSFGALNNPATGSATTGTSAIERLRQQRLQSSPTPTPTNPGALP